ncbi:putative EGF-like module-containing mucin-like hormone receptor-like 3 [Apostichopus japonicus]|uniref:Putative EGF-like module-containing mucin-like hormone receptor-like 3 n=1 Tax=Stichopus japonicus TaxID=307972 RepID=A0A2G8KNC7_STIJA|nr:putative EGF-like module-containing mucin-like hormone receptor-like 3 [Apostichopus japonicus]
MSKSKDSDTGSGSDSRSGSRGSGSKDETGNSGSQPSDESDQGSQSSDEDGTKESGTRDGGSTSSDEDGTKESGTRDGGSTSSDEDGTKESGTRDGGSTSSDEDGTKESGTRDGGSTSSVEDETDKSGSSERESQSTSSKESVTMPSSETESQSTTSKESVTMPRSEPKDSEDDESSDSGQDSQRSDDSSDSKMSDGESRSTGVRSEDSDSSEEVLVVSTQSATVNLTTGLPSATDLTTFAEPCPAENVTISGIDLTFEMTEAGTMANSTQFCPNGTSNFFLPLATRICASPWLDPELTNCFNSSNLEMELALLDQGNITSDNVADVGVILVLASNEPEAISPFGLELILDTLTRIVEVDSESKRVTDSVIGVIDNIIEVNSETLEEVPDVQNIIDLLEKQLSNVQKAPGDYHENRDNVAAIAVKVSRRSLKDGLPYNVSFQGENRKDDDKTFSRTAISIPPSVLYRIPDEDFKTEIPLTFFVFRDTDVFMTSEESDVISPVISAKVDIENVTIRDLPKVSPVVIKFERGSGKESKDSNKDAICVFWDNTNIATGGQWSTEGCETRSEGNDIVCLCNHLTSFALLVRGETESERFVEAYHQVLSIITSVGCYLSVIGLTLCLIMMVASNETKALISADSSRLKLLFYEGQPAWREPISQYTNVQDRPETLGKTRDPGPHEPLPSLIAFYLSFVLGVDRRDNPQMCKVISALIHWFCLASLAWMAVEAFIIYKLIYRFERSNTKHLMLYAIIFAWGKSTTNTGTYSTRAWHERMDGAALTEECWVGLGLQQRSGGWEGWVVGGWMNGCTNYS